MYIVDTTIAVSLPTQKDPVGGYQGIPINMTGIAEKLGDTGYSTHLIGKWDAGMATPLHSPTARGYQSWLGNLHSWVEVAVLVQLQFCCGELHARGDNLIC